MSEGKAQTHACLTRKGGAKREGARQAASWREAASKADFLFVQNFSAVLPKNRQRKMLEEVLRERIRYERSVFIVGAAPSSLTEACLLFEDRSLAASILKEFTVIDPARNEGTSRSARWLF